MDRARPATLSSFCLAAGEAQERLERLVASAVGNVQAAEVV